MAIPSKVTGGGNNHAVQNVFKVAFSTALSAAPQYQMYDNGSAFPARDAAGATVVKEAFTGTAGNGNIPMYALYATTSGASGADWIPAAATPGSANPNRMKGTTSYVTDPTTPGAAGEIIFNICAEFPSDAAVPSSSSQNILLQIQYQYTGAAPVLTYSFNDNDAGGTEGVPVWTALTPGTHGIRLVNTGTVAGTYKFTLPLAGSTKVEELWVTV